MHVSRATRLFRSVLVLSFLSVLPGCAVRHRDYTFGVTGIVTSEDGTPLQDAEVIVDILGPVYAGISPVRTERLKTNSSGGFVVMHLTGEQAGVKYTVTVQKSGFQPQTVSGSAPPVEHHTIRLKREVG